MDEFLHSLQGLDYLILGGILVLIVLGFKHGCSGEIGRLLGLAASALTAYFGSAPLSAWTQENQLLGASQFANQLAAFVLITVVCISVGILTSHILRKVIRFVVPQPFDAILGGVIGGAKALVILSILCSLGWITPHQPVTGTIANTSSVLETISQWVKPLGNHPALRKQP